MKPLEPLLPGETRSEYLDRMERAERKPHKVMTPGEYAATPLQGWHEVCRDIDGFGGVGIRYLGETGAMTEPCNCLMCLAEGDNSPHHRRMKFTECEYPNCKCPRHGRCGNAVHDEALNRRRAVVDGSPTELETRIAIALWHRFGDSGVEEWKDETHKAEFIDAAVSAVWVVNRHEKKCARTGGACEYRTEAVPNAK